MSKDLLNLNELLDCISKIKLYSSEFTIADDFYHDHKSFDATMMQFVVIGEIIYRLTDNFKEINKHIPWQKIKNFRNIIAHDYFGIDADEIWDIINNKLIPLEKDISILLND